MNGTFNSDATAVDLILTLITNFDSDEDGLSDQDEELLGTDPFDPDSDDDGLLDGEEVELAAGLGCPDPLNEDSDGDMLYDGEEYQLGTDPCSADTDNDGIPDSIDPYPLETGGEVEYIVTSLKELCSQVYHSDLQFFTGRSRWQRHGKKRALCAKFHVAARLIRAGHYHWATYYLKCALRFLDNRDRPRDWMRSSAIKESIREQLEEILLLLSFL